MKDEDIYKLQAEERKSIIDDYALQKEKLELELEAGSQFNVQLIDVFIKELRELRFSEKPNYNRYREIFQEVNNNKEEDTDEES